MGKRSSARTADFPSNRADVILSVNPSAAKRFSLLNGFQQSLRTQTATEKTVEQEQKNIKVLNGLPQSQLLPVMNLMSASLGVKCGYCHENKDNKWDFVSDQKPEKGTAREMIQMVLSINKVNFRGNTEVSCFTCHRGRTSPVGVPPLPASESAAGPPNTEEKPREALPTADQILLKYTEALGGSGAIDRVKRRTMKGTWLTANGITLGYELYQAAPDKLLSVLNSPQQGIIEMGFDGSAGWEKTTHGVRDIKGEELFYLRRYPDPFKDIKLKEQFTRLGGAAKDRIDKKEVYILRGVTTDNKRERLYFDAQSGLLIRRVASMATMVGIIPEQVDFEDYRDVDGLKMPFTIRISSIDPFYSSTRKFTEIRLNTPVDDAKFRRPAGQPVPGR